MTERQFPFHSSSRLPIKSIPWRIIDPHESQAIKNHSQNLETLANRGGLDAQEMLAVLTDRHWNETSKLTTQEAFNQIQEIIGRNTTSKSLVRVVEVACCDRIYVTIPGWDPHAVLPLNDIAENIPEWLYKEAVKDYRFLAQVEMGDTIRDLKIVSFDGVASF